MQHLDDMQHLDEGTIHAWLDGALSAGESARVERHAAECAQCAALVAEARGLVAGASRILSALDDVAAVEPVGRGGVVAPSSPAFHGRSRRPLEPVSRVPGALPARRWPVAAAATIVLMVGSALVLRNDRAHVTSGVDSTVAPPLATDSVRPANALPGAATAVPVAPAEAERRLDSEGDGQGRVGAASRARGSAGGRTQMAPPAVAERGETRQFAAGAAAGAAPREELRRAEPAVTTRTALAPTFADAPTAQRAPAAGNAAPVAPPAPAVARDIARKAVTDSLQVAEVVVPGVGEASAVVRRAAARRAPAAAAEEPAAPTAGKEESVAAARVDTVYETRSDTVYYSRNDTIVVERPRAPELRGAGRARRPARLFPVTGCYEVVAGGLPRTVTLTTTPAWSGAAEHRFVAKAPGAVGYWSQPRTGNIHLVIAGTIVTARIDASTGELRGKAQHATSSERFVARRCQ